MARRKTPISQPAPWAWTGGREALAIAEDVAWAAIQHDDARGEFQRQIARVRDQWMRRWAVEWASD